MDYLNKQKDVTLPESSIPLYDPHPPTKPTNSLWELVRFAIVALVIILPIRMYVIQPFIVSGESMIPTFHDRDYLIVDELTYHFREPHRGDVIVFHPPNQPKGIYYIKRIIGLPGEKVSISGAEVTIINDAFPKGFVLSEPYIKNIASETKTFTVGEGEVFVLGDNRPRSSDSRYWGMLPMKNITGRALVRLYPFNSVSLLPGAQETYPTPTNDSVKQ